MTEMSSFQPKSNSSTEYLFLHVFWILCRWERLEKGRRERQALVCPMTGIEKAFAPVELTLCFSCMWKHIQIFSKATICPSPVHFFFLGILNNWAIWKMFPILGSLSTCQPFNFTVPNLLLIRLQNVSSWLSPIYSHQSW